MREAHFAHNMVQYSKHAILSDVEADCINQYNKRPMYRGFSTIHGLFSYRNGSASKNFSQFYDKIVKILSANQKTSHYMSEGRRENARSERNARSVDP